MRRGPSHWNPQVQLHKPMSLLHSGFCQVGAAHPISNFGCHDGGIVNETPCGNLGGSVDAHYDIAPNTLSPLMPIEGNMSLIKVASASPTDPADQVSSVRLVYDIAF